MSTVIVGGGITGLSAAWTLMRAGREVTLIEPGPVGGLLRTESVDGCTVECGADSWIRAKSTLRELAGELGLADQILPCNDALRGTFIVRRGRLIPYPAGMRLIVPTQLGPTLTSRLFGWQTKLRMLRELSRRPASLPDRSVAEFVRDRFGADALEYLAEPLLGGIYGGSPEVLSVQSVFPKLAEYERTVGSIIRGAHSEPAVRGPIFESMKQGLGQLPTALAQKLDGPVRFVRAPAEAVAPGCVRVAGQWLAADRIILACGAVPSSTLLAGTAAADIVGRIPHSSATIYAFAFRRNALRNVPRGFGFLVPRKERQTILAATWVTNKFAFRAPPDTVVVRCFVAGDHGDALIPELLADLKRIAAINAPPLFSRVYRWPDSLPQFQVGHRALLDELAASLPPSIAIAGGLLGAIGMPDCARSGIAAAQAVLKKQD